MKRWLFRLVVVLALAGMTAGGFAYWVRGKLAAPGPAFSPTSVVVHRGATVSAIAQQMAEAGVIDRPWLFTLAVRVPRGRPLLAGEYLIPTHASMGAIVDMMRKGQVVVRKVTIAEGLTSVQIVTQLRNTEGLTGGAGDPPPDGTLMPQTYFFTFGDTRESIMARMTSAMTENFDEVWAKRAPGYPLDKRQAMILASVVERETAVPEERSHVAAVFLNRLRLRMRLQSDPTVSYAVTHGMGGLDRSLTHDDLAIDSPYNTYVVDGLPAGPICNPGRASMEAAVNPARSDDLYFVADGKGGHVFAKTLVDHNRNVAHWRAQRNGQAEPAATHPKKH